VPQIQAYSTEVTIPLDQIAAFPIPTIPAEILQAIQGGAQEIRHSVTYTASTRSLSVRTFLVAPGSPNPTPPAAQTAGIERYDVNVESILWPSTTVVPPGTNPGSFVINGRIAGGAVPSLVFRDLANSLFVHAVGYSGTTPRTFNNVTTVVAGRYAIYAPEGRGTLTFSTDPGPGPGPDGNQPPVVNPTAGQNATTALPQIQLSAGATDPEGDTLTYSWRFVGKSASIIGPTTATPSVQFGEGFGSYVFEVTVTDSAGNFTTGQVTVMYVGR
jgi:hypothetical protein